ncbi:ABC transporter permease subunit [Paenibacillus sp. 1011MAR3C5]|uniref:ABC transporter permease subunit n=1 Tax=Paenibacillus sp. 1011MAR3C5 TaxID=1675787 RepID=UPI000E6B7595|nr:ABC transporter permease subunit [Paenibacillus sp. 1011MAR3C5]RJE86940.1 ABC transporter permease subunit [Paenibacillus sp. 1011MAR3C5]
MPKAAQMTIIIPGIILFVCLFAMMPVVLHFGPGDGGLQFSWGQGYQSFKDYVAGLWTGESFTYYSGKNEHHFWDRIGSYFLTSFYYVTAASMLGSLIGIFIGIYFAVSKAGWAKSLADFIGALPDFVIVLLLQFIIVLIAKETGVVLFEVATLSADDPAVVLPLLAMIIIPANYMLRNVAMQMKLTLTEDYISNAKAKGLGKLYIIFYHGLPNVLPYVKGDLHKLMGIVMGNLFIVEYLFNNKGVSMLIFAHAFVGGEYQYDIVVNGLLSFLLLYGLGYAILRVFLFVLGKVFE